MEYLRNWWHRYFMYYAFCTAKTTSPSPLFAVLRNLWMLTNPLSKSCGAESKRSDSFTAPEKNVKMNLFCKGIILVFILLLFLVAIHCSVLCYNYSPKSREYIAKEVAMLWSLTKLDHFILKMYNLYLLKSKTRQLVHLSSIFASLS